LIHFLPGHLMQACAMAALLLLGSLAFAGVVTYWIFFARSWDWKLGWTGLNRCAPEKSQRHFLRLIKVIVAPLILGTLITACRTWRSRKSAGSAGKACSILK